jgi:hypothetical protein
MAYTKPRSIEAQRAAEECVTCAILIEYGPESPVAMRLISNRIGRPLFGPKWVQFLRDHEDYHLNKGERVLSEICADAIDPKLLLTVFAEAQPRIARPVVKPLTDEEKALAEFEHFARPEVKQVDKRTDKRPIVKPLNTQAFAGFNEKEEK